MKAVGLGLLLGLAACAAWVGGCYRDLPPCDPTTIDYPACIDPTQPKVARDGGADR